MSEAEPPEEAHAPVGALGASRLARVDKRGGITFDGSPVALEWWIGAEDRWHVAHQETAVRRRRLDTAPAYETAMRIPSGDAIHRVYAIGGAGDPIILEVENASPAPVALALVVRGMPGGIELDKTRVDLDRTLQLRATKPASHAVAASDGGALLAAIDRGVGADTAPTMVPSGAGVVALLTPITHRTRARFAILLDPRRASEIDLAAAPDAQDVERGWAAMRQRGMQVVFADAGRQLETDRARVDVLLEAGLATAGPDLFAALEDWGLDAEAVEVWRRLGWRGRRRAGRRDADVGLAAARFLRATRDALIAERNDGVIVLAPEPPVAGQPLEVHGAPTRCGFVSFAVRWHGERPALLWDVQPEPDSLRMVAPALDPAWSTGEPSGEALLGSAAVNRAGA